MENRNKGLYNKQAWRERSINLRNRQKNRRKRRGRKCSERRLRNKEPI